MLTQHLNLRLNFRRNSCGHRNLAVCPVVIHPSVKLFGAANSACLAKRGPPRQTIAHAGGRVPGLPEEPTPGVPNDEFFLDEDENFDLDDDEDGKFVQQLDPMSRKLIGVEASDADEYEEGELDAEEDEASLEESAGAGARLFPSSDEGAAVKCDADLHGYLIVN